MTINVSETIHFSSAHVESSRGIHGHRFRLHGSPQLVFGHLAASKGTGDVRAALVGPAVELGLRIFHTEQKPKTFGHCGDVKKGFTALQLGIEHDGAGDMANGPVRSTLENRHHATKVQ